MTKPEAAEVILGGVSWEKCRDCDYGVYYRGLDSVWCGTCDGSGFMLPSHVYEALNVLNFPLPQEPIGRLPTGWCLNDLSELRESSYRNKYG